MLGSVQLAKTKQMSAQYSLDHHVTIHIPIRKTPALRSNTHHNQKSQHMWRLTPIRLCLFLLLFAFVLAGCGPDEETAASDLAAETLRIAQEYQQSSDLGNARAQLEKLDVANPTQFLILLAEERVNSAAGTPETNALVHLALAMGVQSSKLMTYGMANGLLANVAAPTPAVVAQPAAQSLAPVTSSEQTPAADAPPPTAAVVAVIATATPTGTVSAAVSVDSSTTLSSEVSAGADVTGTQATGEVPAAADPLPTLTTQAPTPTVVSKPQIQASNGVNVRSGPGTDYPVAGAINGGEQADIVAKNPQGDWWQVALPTGGTGWVYGPLVQAVGDTASIVVATDIPAAPPTPTPAPIAEVPTAAPEQPTEAPPAEAPPAALPGNDFYKVERRLWSVEETGGVLDSGGSVRCGEKRELHVVVLDANGNRINGVAVQAIYGAQEIFVTGAQGKGDGQVEFVLGAGQGVKVIRDADGREVTSDVVDGMSTHSPDIDDADLISAKYCWDTASCDKFNYSAGCWGHHSWTVTFKRKY